MTLIEQFKNWIKEVTGEPDGDVEPAEDTVWLPGANLAHVRKVLRILTLKDKTRYVEYELPERCPCCETLIRTERESYSSIPLEDWNAWVKKEEAVQIA